MFELSGEDIGELKSITIGHDNSGIGPGWYLDSVTVESLYVGKKYTATCDRW